MRINFFYDSFEIGLVCFRIQKSQNKAMKSQLKQVESSPQQDPAPQPYFHQQLPQTPEQHPPQVQEQTFSLAHNLDVHEQASLSSSLPDPESSGNTPNWLCSVLAVD
jgi:hypothetical protein